MAEVGDRKYSSPKLYFSQPCRLLIYITVRANPAAFDKRKRVMCSLLVFVVFFLIARSANELESVQSEERVAY